MSIVNLTRGSVMARQVGRADTSLKRMQGLLGRDSLEKDEALIISACQSIHMFFMKFPIDVVFINRSQKVVGLTKGIKPWGLSPIFWKADSAIELPSGTIDTTGTQIGDQLEIS